MMRVLGAIGFIGFALYLLNYYGWYGFIPIALILLFRNRSIPISKRVELNVGAGIIAPLSMIYPLMKIGFTINHDFKMFLIIAVATIVLFSRLESYSVVTHFLPAVILGNVAVYYHVSPAVAVPVLYLIILLFCDGFLLLIALRRTHECIIFEIGKDGFADGLVALPGLMFLGILYVVWYMYSSPIIPSHYLFIKKGLYH